MSQITINVDGKKIKIVSRARTYVGNFCGWSVRINGEKFLSNQLEESKAIDHCYVRWVKKQPSVA